VVLSMRLLIAAQVRLYRDGLAHAFSCDGRHEVVGAAATSPEALELVIRLEPDVVLLDSTLPRVSLLVREVTSRSGKVVVLGVEEDKEEILPLVEDGASGYVTRDGSLADLFSTVEGACRGEFACSPRVVAGMMARLAAMARVRPTVDAPRPLTTRERQIASLIDQGLSNRDIAARLQIRLPTVKNHVHNILDKLEVHRRGEAVARLRARSL
jgi:two-component system, NarL family, nitrate/nitrite response regulator NarL